MHAADLVPVFLLLRQYPSADIHELSEHGAPDGYTGISRSRSETKKATGMMRNNMSVAFLFHQ